MVSRRTSVLVAALLFAASAAVTLWQNAHVAVLWDLSYLLDSAFRFSLGQAPYRDLPFAHAPVTFLVQAALIRCTGRVYWHHIAYAALANGAATIFTWRILLHQLRGRLPHASSLSLLLAAPLTVLGVYSIYPHPIYDSDAVLAVLFALFLLHRTCAHSPGAPSTHTSGAPSMPRSLRHGWGGDARILLPGAALILPLFIKQNIGLLFLTATIATLAVLALSRRLQHQSCRNESLVLLGALLTFAASLLAIHVTAGLHNYIYWTITFAAQRRLPGLGLVLGTYHQTSLLWTLPATLTAISLLYISRSSDHKPQISYPEPQIRYPESQIRYPEPQIRYPEVSTSGFMASLIKRGPRLQPRTTQLTALLLLAAPFLYTLLATPFLDDPSDRTDQLLSLWPHLLLLATALAACNLFRRPTLNTLLPLVLLATIHGTFLSQQLWGSTYALWPLLMLLLAAMLRTLHRLAPGRFTLALTTIITTTLTVCGAAYAFSHDRLSYIHLDGAPAHSTLPALRGLTTPGPWLPALDELAAYTTTHIPPTDTVLLFPGQDPFFYATGRPPRFSVLLFDPATNPYTPTQLAQQVTQQNVRWLIVPRRLQLTQPPLDNYAAYLATLAPLFTPAQTLTNYTLYRRR